MLGRDRLGDKGGYGSQVVDGSAPGEGGNSTFLIVGDCCNVW